MGPASHPEFLSEAAIGVASVNHLGLPEDYAAVLNELKQRVVQARYRAQRQVNTELIRMYWQIGKIRAESTDDGEWGSKVIDRLSTDLRTAFPGSRGFSPRNLLYMRSFARSWFDLDAIAQQPVAQLPWGHITVLLDKLAEPQQRDWYASQAVTHGWSRAVLEHHIKTRAHQRFAAAPTNFDASDQARQLTKDPYVLDFLRVEPGHAERELEQALVDRIQQTLGELGTGFSFVGRQVAFDVDGEEFSSTCCSSMSSNCAISSSS